MRKRHNICYKLIRPLATLFVRFRFGYTYEVAKNLPENYLVLSNHTTDYDLVLVTASFPRMMYFVGSEHIARWKRLYKFLKFAFDPIMRPKGTSAALTIKEMMRRAKAGHNVCLFAEGVRSWDGTPSPIAPSTAKMVQRMNCGLVTYRITGGYFASPMWGGASVRKGPIHGAPVRVFTKEQVAAMSTEELYEIICTDLGEDAYPRQLADPQPYICKEPAKGLEYLLFACPECGSLDTISTSGSIATCSHCGLSFRYNEYGMLENAPFKTLVEYHSWQKQKLREHMEQGGVLTAPHAVLNTVRQHVESVVTDGPVTMTPDALCCGDMTLPMEEIYDMAMHGQRALVFTAGKTYYELIVDEHTNTLKFFLLYQLCKERVPEKAAT